MWNCGQCGTVANVELWLRPQDGFPGQRAEPLIHEVTIQRRVDLALFELLLNSRRALKHV
jgi:hypothetical protein